LALISELGKKKQKTAKLKKKLRNCVTHGIGPALVPQKADSLLE